MKILVAVVAFSFIISGAVSDTNAEAAADDDIKKCFTGLNKEEVLRAKTFEAADWSPNMRCALKCLLDKANLTDAITGEFLPKDVRYDLISPGTDDEKIIEGCKISKGDNACDTTFLTVQCLVNAEKNETSNNNDDKAVDIKKCFAGLNKEEVLRAKTFESADWSPNMRCALKCLLDKANLTDAITGEFLPKDVRYDLISPGTDDEKIIEGCKISKGDNACDTTFLTVQCLVNAEKNETSNNNDDKADDKADDIKKCFAGLNKEEVLRAVSNISEPADWSPKMRCVFKCLMDALKLTDPVTGEFLPKEVRYDMISPGTEYDKMVEGCKISKGDNACDTTFLTVQCIMNGENKLFNNSYDIADNITNCLAGLNKEEALRAKTFEPADWSPKMRCAFKCLMDAMKFTDAVTGELLPKEVRYVMISPGSEHDKMIEGCKISKGDNACDTAFLTAHCLVNVEENKQINNN